MPRSLVNGRTQISNRRLSARTFQVYIAKYQQPAAIPINLNPVSMFGAALTYLFDAASVNVVRDGSGNVLQWKDTSGNNRHLTPSATLSSGYCRWIDRNQSFANQPTIRFPGPETGGPRLDSGSAWTTIPQPRTTVTVFASNSRTNSGVIYSSQTADNHCYHETNGQIRINNGTDFATGYGNTIAGIAGSNTGNITITSDVAHVLIVEENGASTKLWVDGVLKATGNAGALSRATLRLGGRSIANSSTLIGDIAYHFQINRAFTAGELLTVSNALNAAFIPGLIFCDGDSTTYGRGSTGENLQPAVGPILNAFPNSYAGLLQTNGFIKKPFQLRNAGIGGEKIQTMLANGPTVIDPMYSSIRPFNISFLWGGANDVAAGRTAAQIYADIAAYATARAAVGWTVVVRTMPWLILTAPQDIVRLDTNTLTRTNASNAPYILDDAGSDPLYQAFDASIMVADSHPNDRGYFEHAKRISLKLNLAIP